MAQTLRKHHVRICAKKKVFYFQHKRSYSRKTKNMAILVHLSENSSMCEHSLLTVISETISSHLINAVCDMLHQ